MTTMNNEVRNDPSDEFVFTDADVEAMDELFDLLFSEVGQPQ